jgi:hypothetical protein
MLPAGITDGNGLRRRRTAAPNERSNMATPDRESLATGLVSIGEDAVARSNDALLDDYTDDYTLHSPAGAFNRDEIKTYFAALRESFTDFTISRAQILVDGPSSPPVR